MAVSRRIRPKGARVVSAVASDGRRAWLLRFACWTDLLARSADFAAFAREIAEHAARSDCDGLLDGERPLLAQPFGTATVARALEQARERFHERVRIADFARLASPAGRVGAYVHHDHQSGALVSLAASAPPETLARTLKSLCQHVVAFRPACVGDEPPTESGVVPEGEALLDQPWIHDPALRLREALARELGPRARVEAFRRMQRPR
jgi:translation elongation factor EF-Ts